VRLPRWCCILTDERRAEPGARANDHVRHASCSEQHEPRRPRSWLILIVGRRKTEPMTDYQEAAEAIEAFLEGRGGAWAWDDFTSIKKKDAFLESARVRCLTVRSEYPAKEKSHYCSPEGMNVLRALAREIRGKREPNQSLQPTRPSGPRG
jgi:hypothetical protein